MYSKAACFYRLYYLVTNGASAFADSSTGRDPSEKITGDFATTSKIDGKHQLIYFGEFQYCQLPSPFFWLEVLQKMKAAGFNVVSIYFNWTYHWPKRGVYDFSSIQNVINCFPLMLVVTGADDGIGHDDADWTGAKIINQ